MKKLFKNHWPAVLIAVVFGFLFLWLGNKSPEPSCSVETPRSLAVISVETPQLEILWKGENIQNAYTAQILIWNNGRGYLDGALIKKTNPLRVEYQDHITLLDWQITKRSRENLQINLSRHDGKVRQLYLDVSSDDSMEKKDGVLIQVLYTSEREAKSSDFEVLGGIKGIKNGWSRVRWSRLQEGTSTLSKIVFPLVLLVVMGMYIIIAVSTYKRVLPDVKEALKTKKPCHS